MATLKFDTTSMIKAMSPGLPSLVVAHFKEQIEKDMNGVIEEAYTKALKTLPTRVETHMMSFLDPTWGGDVVKVLVDLRTDKYDNTST